MIVFTEPDYFKLREGATVAAADLHGDKVLRLADGTYLKLFRIKRLLTSARLFPYSRRFANNALQLRTLDIPTLEVIKVLNIPSQRRTAVHYHPLPGLTIRELAAGIDPTMAGKLGRFIKNLHDRGVYLRSMHLGNLVATSEGELGLIDIADMRIFSRPLSRRLRIRNFRHLCRYAEDRRDIAAHFEHFAAAFDDSFRATLATMFAPD